MELIPYSQYRRTLLHVDLSAPPSERWAEAGAKVGEELNEALPEVVDSRRMLGRQNRLLETQLSGG